MKISTIKKKIALFLINNLFSCTRFFSIKRNLLNWADFSIGKGTKIVGPLIVTSNLQVGENTWIGRDFKCYGNGLVKIGSNCDIAPNVTISTGGHKIGNDERRAGDGEIYNITIEDGVWICVNSTLCKNIKIGKSSIVAACACVINDVKENVIVGGVPAKVIKKI